MSGYLQTSTENPYGHRPWATRLYTTFDDFAFLKQPQNLVLRDAPGMRPEIYKPPELKLAGLGAIVVNGSGRVVGRMRRRGMRGLGAIYPTSQIIIRGPIYSNGGAPMPGPMPVAPITLLPPGSVPPVPTPVTSGPGGTLYALPGNTSTPGSPFAPPATALGPGIPTTQDAGAAAAAANPSGSLTDWLSAQTYISGVPNGALAAGVAVGLWMLARKSGRR